MLIDSDNCSLKKSKIIPRRNKLIVHFDTVVMDHQYIMSRESKNNWLYTYITPFALRKK
jgi:hypothetical protein